MIALVLLLAGLGATRAEAPREEEGTPTPSVASERREPEPCDAPTGRLESPFCSPTPGAPPDPSQPRSRRSGEPEGQRGGWTGWADAHHESLEQGIFGFVQRVDGFFGDPSRIQFNTPAYSVRLRSGLRVGQDNLFRADASVIADLRLPTLEKALSRARLFVAGGADEDQVQSGTEQDLVPRRIGSSLGASHGAVELRFDLLRGRRSVVDLGGGVRFDYPVPPYVRLRGAHAEDLGLGLVGHVNQTGFWERRVGFGESTRFDMERVLNPTSIARAWAIGTLHERSRGLEWAAETGFAQGLGARTGLYLAAALEGATRPVAQVDRYRVYTRLRRDIHDAWLFAELEPEVSWPLEISGQRPRVLAATFRVEVQFANRGR